MEQLYLFFKLLLAHLIGDFWLQPTKWVNQRDKHQYKSRYLYYHALIHGLLALIVLLSGNAELWYLSILVLITHLLIDLIKSYQKKNKIQWFVSDQLLHLLVITGLWFWATDRNPVNLIHEQFYNMKFWMIVTAVVALTSPSGIFISIATERWRKQVQNDKEKTLKDAGKWIGVIERLLIFVFVVASQYEAVGFLLAAKSIFRFGDLRNAEEKNQTEYLIIGTLLSFGIAVLTGIIVRLLLL